jgi:hypothetical protein
VGLGPTLLSERSERVISQGRISGEAELVFGASSSSQLLSCYLNELFGLMQLINLCLVSTCGSVHLLFLPRQYMKRTNNKMDTEDEFEEEAEENLSVETEDESTL